MARPSRQQAASASSATALKKRRLPSSQVTPTRESKRLKSSPVTLEVKIAPKKSESHESKTQSEAESTIEREASGYEDEDGSVSELSTPASEEEEDGYSSAEEAPRKQKFKTRQGGTNSVAKSARPVKGKELWRPGVKSDLAPGEEVFIKLPKAREAGSTPYKDDAIHPNTMAFLKDLKQNNDRDWLKVHDADYRQSQKDWNSFVESLTEKVIEKDETIPELPPKDLTFRIYRDVRFSSDPTPYKTYYSAAWSRTGRKGPYAGYYLQIKPGNGSFVGAGLWQPEAGPLALLRQAIDTKSEKLKEVLVEPGIRKEFLKGVTNDVTKVVKAFTALNTENMLKTKPKGYFADNPNILLLRLRNFTIGKNLADDEILGPGALVRIADLIGVLTPFVTYLNSVVMPDEASDDDEDDNDGDDGEGYDEGDGEGDDESDGKGDGEGDSEDDGEQNGQQDEEAEGEEGEGEDEK